MSSIIFSRAVPVLAEIDRSFNLDPGDVEAKFGAFEDPAQGRRLEEVAGHAADGQPFDRPHVAPHEGADLVPFFEKDADEVRPEVP